MNKPKRKISYISALHYLKLIFRSVLFIGTLVTYVVFRINGGTDFLGEVDNNTLIIAIVWVIFVYDMIMRFFPSKMESMGCQKQFARNFIPTKRSSIRLNSWKSTFAVAVSWLLLNSVFGVLYFAKLIDEGILLLISLAFSVCDMICILFFCPFQTWFMKNKCCGSCRIYNWDYAMMFTPLIFVKGYYTWSLLGIALLLLAVWELIVHIHPERFSEQTNAGLSCANCKEKLCQHKVQLRVFLKKNKDRLMLKGNEFVDKFRKPK